MIRVTIDGREAKVPLGTTVLEAARSLGIRIPTLCYRQGLRPGTSCMLCVVRIEGLRRLVPSCAFPVRDGLVVQTATDEIIAARRAAVELLLTEHVGDCEGPCRRSCPAHMNIPLMIRQIGGGRLREALVTVKQSIALPAVLGRICPAPCEKACRRGALDTAVSICLLKRHVADVDLAGEDPWVPGPVDNTGRKVAVVGAGPAGLSAAFYLRMAGHTVSVFDERGEPGGSLREAIPVERLPRDVLDAEIEAIRRSGVVFHSKVRVGKTMSMDDLRKDFNAVVLAVGSIPASGADYLGVPMAERGIRVTPRTFAAGVEGVFAIGNAVRVTRMAIRSCADGKEAAFACDQFLRGHPVTGEHRRFNSIIQKVTEAELAEFLKQADKGRGIVPSHASGSGFNREEAVLESRRCLHCDCRKSEHCGLRDMAEVFGADARRFHEADRHSVEIVRQRAGVVYEPGKCIRCGLCVRITEKHGEELGLAFVSRGFEMKVRAPYGEPFERAMKNTAAECVEACPTGALAWDKP